MAADLGLISLAQHQDLVHQPPDLGFAYTNWMWNTRPAQEEEDSWEVRAFAEDTSSASGTTWPPRSYTCAFCRREFRSAQALGGHMNVHRRDRARLHQSSLMPGYELIPSSYSFPSPTLFPAQEIAESGGLRLLCPFVASGGTTVFTPIPVPAKGCLDSPSTLLSIAPYAANDMTPSCSLSSPNLPMVTEGVPSSCHFCEDNDRVTREGEGKRKDQNEMDIEEVDLELRLGQRPR